MTNNNNDESGEKLIPWQPTTVLKGVRGFDYTIEEVLRHNDYFKITMKDLHGNALDILYDDPDHVCPLEYFVWGFKYHTELGSLSRGFEQDENQTINKDTICLYKVEHSDFIKEFDHNPVANKELYPSLEHHLFMTGDEMVEVLSNYEPRFVERK